MHTAIYAIALIAAGYVVASAFLAITRPAAVRSPNSCSIVQDEGREVRPSSAHSSEIPLTTTAMQHPKFWELSELSTLKKNLAPRTFSIAEFKTPAHRAPSPLEPVFFLHEPDKFVQKFKDCEEDSNCYITYHHVPKTGGTTVESALSQIFDQKSESSCCNDWMLRVFRNNTDHFCDSKFTSWQMEYPKYFEVLDTCFKRDTEKKRRVLMLISIREVSSDERRVKLCRLDRPLA